jgi:hypothetical protein
MSVERRHHRRRLARDVDQDRGGRAAVLRAVIDTGEHDERAGWINLEGERQQHGDGCDRTDAGKHSDQSANEASNEGEQEIDGRQCGGKAESEIADPIEHGHALIADQPRRERDRQP